MVTRYKINKQNLLYFYIGAVNSWTKNEKVTTPFTVVLKIKYLDVNLTKHVKD